MKGADGRGKEGMKKWERLESYPLLPSFHVLSLRCNRKAILDGSCGPVIGRSIRVSS
jgi:hypothetical protein